MIPTNRAATQQVDTSCVPIVARPGVAADPLGDYLEQFVRRIIQDALAEATAAYWLRRAAAFEWARGGPNHPEQDKRCAETASMCRLHADLLSDPELWRDELDEYLAYLNGDTTSHPWAAATPWADTSERAVA